MPCRLVAILLLLAAVTGCTSARSPVRREVSGFLDDYSTLREGGPGEVALVYRNPQADWKSYDKVLLEPVTLWRSGRKSLDAVPEEDLLRLVDGLESAVRRRLGEGFGLVENAGSEEHESELSLHRRVLRKTRGETPTLSDGSPIFFRDQVAFHHEQADLRVVRLDFPGLPQARSGLLVMTQAGLDFGQGEHDLNVAGPERVRLI